MVHKKSEYLSNWLFSQAEHNNTLHFFFLRKLNTLHLDKKNQLPVWGLTTLTAEQRKLCYAPNRSAKRDVQNLKLRALTLGVPNIWHLAYQTPKDFSHHIF